ncbi:MAG: DUF87 domain-containing protein [Methanoregulaceae archaeon]|nr:DUF87 domain-containing protein [Methanoregulaceae archaeon]
MLNQTAGQLLQDNPLVQLIQAQNFVGWIYSIDYDRALVMTNDLWKAEALGVPHNCFLIAATFDPSRFNETHEDDREVIVLRVVGSCKLPQDDDLVRTKIDHFQQQEDIFQVPSASDTVRRDFDDITRSQMQFGGLECRVLGTFFVRGDALCLGSDLESFSTATRLRVYRPRASALETIVNHIDPARREAALAEARALGIENPVAPLRVGTVRYTSTDRLHRGGQAEMVPVFIQPSDFLARRTAVLGMTRTGKSNMVKQTVSVVKRVADQSGVNIGQLIYDINGEYANANQQDRGSIADIYPDDTVRYRMLQTEGFLELQNNFYVQVNEGFGLIQRDLRERGRGSTVDYVTAFMNMSLDEPDAELGEGERHRWQRRQAAYFCLLFKAGYEPPRNLRVQFSANERVRNAVNAAAGEDLGNPGTGLPIAVAVRWFEAAREANQQNSLPGSSAGSRWIDDTLQNLLDMLVQSGRNGNFISGWRIITDGARFHSPRRAREVGGEIYEHLQAGRIVILDLSVGDPTIRSQISKEIASHVFNASMAVFVRGEQPPNILVYIEEAHNLIGKGMDLTETWPRLAKEGAKYRIGLVYATQEVSSVHPNILANTENWFVTHLNNDREIRELAHFYDFGDFSRSLLRAQDVGFARVKMLSGPFVVPVQIDRFDPEAARAQTAG